VAVCATTVALTGVGPGPALAQDTDDEGGTESLREQLDEAATKYQDAKAELDESEKRELKLTVKLESLEEDRKAMLSEVQLVAAAAYRTGRVGGFTALLNSNSPTAFLERVVAIDMLAKRDAEVLAGLRELSETAEEQKALLAEEIALQEKEVAKLEEAKDQAEAALAAIGGGANGDFVPYESELAEPAPRNDDGSWPAESCSEDDPTTSGCLSPRMLHAYNEARIFGFTRYTSCWRSGSYGEHPSGRACDFAASPNGFGGVAVGNDKIYGDRLASFFVANADGLGVQYVIWYRQVWFPGNGWQTYGGGGGDPASDHTNHVHASIR
jgi:hypothetical protein